MKRSPLPRSTKPLKRTPIARGTKPIKAKRVKPRKVSVLRDRKFLDWLKSQRCVVTLLRGFPLAIVNMPHLHWKANVVDPAHGPPAGMRVKGPDNEAIPLTRYYHEEQTRLGWPAFEEKYAFSRREEAAKLYSRYLRGR